MSVKSIGSTIHGPLMKFLSLWIVSMLLCTLVLLSSTPAAANDSFSIEFKAPVTGMLQELGGEELTIDGQNAMVTVYQSAAQITFRAAKVLALFPPCREKKETGVCRELEGTKNDAVQDEKDLPLRLVLNFLNGSPPDHQADIEQAFADWGREFRDSPAVCNMAGSEILFRIKPNDGDIRYALALKDTTFALRQLMHVIREEERARTDIVPQEKAVLTSNQTVENELMQGRVTAKYYGDLLEHKLRLQEMRAEKSFADFEQLRVSTLSDLNSAIAEAKSIRAEICSGTVACPAGYDCAIGEWRAIPGQWVERGDVVLRATAKRQ